VALQVRLAPVVKAVAQVRLAPAVRPVLLALVVMAARLVGPVLLALVEMVARLVRPVLQALVVMVVQQARLVSLALVVMVVQQALLVVMSHASTLIKIEFVIRLTLYAMQMVLRFPVVEQRPRVTQVRCRKRSMAATQIGVCLGPNVRRAYLLT
jgi:hypothetical protein